MIPKREQCLRIAADIDDDLVLANSVMVPGTIEPSFTCRGGRGEQLLHD